MYATSMKSYLKAAAAGRTMGVKPKFHHGSIDMLTPGAFAAASFF